MSTTSVLVVPQGSVVDSIDRRTTNFIQIKARAQDIEELYKDCGLVIPPKSGLAKLIDNAQTLSDRWLANKLEGLTIVHALYALQLQRIADAVLPLTEVPDRTDYLKSLTKGEIDFFEREASPAKDRLWELELWALLRARGGRAFLKDPPDIKLDLGQKTLGIACKKVYSENNVEKVLSQAVAQVEKDYDVGVAALNVDELVPEGAVLKVKTEREMSRSLQQHCAQFIRRHERHFRKYLSTGRLVAALVSIHVVADVEEWDVSINNSRHSTVWVIPGLATEKAALVRQFEHIVTG